MRVFPQLMLTAVMCGCGGSQPATSPDPEKMITPQPALPQVASQPVASRAEAKETAIQSRPNVILILSDDMGYSDLPKFGESEIITPAVDRLAAEGTLFTVAYVIAPICVASQMGLLTGQYQQRFGVCDNIYGEQRVRLFLRQTLLPAVFLLVWISTGWL